MSEFEYDIAISYLKEDEQLAQLLFSELKDQFEVFIYSKRQRELAGTDGQNTFSEIFGEKSRTVLVLYREKWGKTKWTRVEETAIKSRWFDDGHEFLLLVPIEEAKPPKWFPEIMIYYNYKNFGYEGLPPVIYNHLKRNRAKEKDTSIDSKIEKIENEKKFKKELADYLLSPNASQDFTAQVQKIVTLFDERAEEINKKFKTVKFEVTESIASKKCVIRHNNFELNFYYRSSFVSTQKLSDIEFKLYKGYHVGYTTKPPLLGEEKFLMSKDRLGNLIWESKNGKEFSTDELVENKLKELVKIAN